MISSTKIDAEGNIYHFKPLIHFGHSNNFTCINMKAYSEMTHFSCCEHLISTVLESVCALRIYMVINKTYCKWHDLKGWKHFEGYK